MINSHMWLVVTVLDSTDIEFSIIAVSSVRQHWAIPLV